MRRCTPQASQRELTAGAPERERFAFTKNCGGWDEISRQFVCLTVPAGDLIDQATVIDGDTIEIQRRLRLSPGSGSLGNLKNAP
jgi:hypothetical protein